MEYVYSIIQSINNTDINGWLFVLIAIAVFAIVITIDHYDR